MEDFSQAEKEILFALKSKGEMYGPHIANAIAELLGKSYIGGVTSLYPSLHHLEKEGFIESRWGELQPEERGGNRRKFYGITKKGIAWLEEESEREGDGGFAIA